MNDKIYMKEFQYWNGERFITFDMLEMSDTAVVVAVTNEGKISVCEYELWGLSGVDIHFSIGFIILFDYSAHICYNAYRRYG